MGSHDAEEELQIRVMEMEEELEKLRKLKAKLSDYWPSLHDLLLQEIEAGR